MENKKYIEFSCQRAGSGKIELTSWGLELEIIKGKDSSGKAAEVFFNENWFMRDRSGQNNSIINIGEKITLYDAKNRPLIFQHNEAVSTVTYPDGKITEFHHDTAVHYITYLPVIRLKKIIPPSGIETDITWVSSSLAESVTQAGKTIKISSPSADKRTVTDTTANTRVEYTFNSESDCIREEFFMGNQSKRIVETVLDYRTNKKTETDNKGNKVVTTYNNKDKIISEVSEFKFKKVIDGEEVGNELLRTIATTYTYVADNLEKEESIITVTDTVINTILKEKTAWKEYKYEDNKLVKTTDSNGIVQEVFYDGSGSVFKQETYRKDDLTKKFIQDKETTTCEGETEAEPTIDDLSDELKNLSAKDCYELKNSTEFIYEKDMLKKVTSGNTFFEFKYNFGEIASIETNFDGDAPYVNFSKQVLPQGLQESTATYASGEEIKTITDGVGNLLTVKNENQMLIENAYNADMQLIISKDCVSGVETKFEYDSFGQVVKSSNKQVAVTIDTDILGNVEKTKINIAGFEPQEYQTIYNDKGQIESVGQESLKYDNLGRVENITTPAETKQIYYKTVGTKTSNQITSVISEDVRTQYRYDCQGNITEIIENGKVVSSYKYDNMNRLVEENGIRYQYDSNGNMLRMYLVNGNYEASCAYNGDRIADVEYDKLGNPKNHKGKKCVWSNLRQLDKLGDTRFTYDANGLRQSKEHDKTEVQYVWSGNKLLAEKRVVTHSSIDLGEEIPEEGFYIYATSYAITYTYGVNSVIGFELKKNSEQPKQYWYKKNILGDVVAIVCDGETVAKYKYDAWGNCEIVLDVDGIGTLNAIRYRGYYYDVETGLYYLKSRYYDSEIGRFINADDISEIRPEMVNGLNLFAYCGNNPVMNVDPSGRGWWKNFWKVVAGVAIIAVLAVGTVVTGGALSVVLAGATIGAIGGALGATVSTAISGDWGDFGNNFLFGTIAGGVSGAIGASGLGLGWQIAINASLGMTNYAVTTAINGGTLTLGGLLFSGITGGIAGWIGGAGAMKGNTMATAFAAFGGKNFFATMGANVSNQLMGTLFKEFINAFVIGGLVDGLYARLASRFNPNDIFFGLRISY